MNWLFLSVLQLLFLPPQQKSPVTFSQEYIEFRLDGDKFTVNGIYVFVNHRTKSLAHLITYPFPVPTSKIDSVYVFDTNKGVFLKFTKQKKGINFEVEFPPNDTVKLNIFYIQSGVSDTARYILTTTQAWGSPLSNAEYSFEADPAHTVKSFSYPPDKTTRLNNRTKYFWRMKNFLPDHDFEVFLAK
jgi:hypothetical protein